MKFKQIAMIGLGMVLGGGMAIYGVANSSAFTGSNVAKITAEKARTIMLEKVPGGDIVEFSFDSDDKIKKYDGTVIKDNTEYEVDVDANTGEVIKFEKEDFLVENVDNNSNNNNNSNNQGNSSDNTQGNNTSFIGEAKAKEIMLANAPGASFKSFYLDNDDTPEYEGELINGNTEYDISVDAKTGAIKEFDKEVISSTNNPVVTPDNDDDRYDNDDDDDKYDDDRYDNDDDDKYDDDRYDNDDDDDKYDDDRYDNDDDDDKYDDDRYDNDDDDNDGYDD